MIGQFLDTIIVASIIIAVVKSGFDEPSLSTSWKLLETVLSHLEMLNNN